MEKQWIVLKNAFEDVNILDDISFKEPLQNDPEKAKERAAEWANSVIEKLSIRK